MPKLDEFKDAKRVLQRATLKFGNNKIHFDPVRIEHDAIEHPVLNFILQHITIDVGELSKEDESLLLEMIGEKGESK